MAKYYTNTEELTSIADAIRAKSGTTESLEYPQGFVNAIEGISVATTATGVEIVDTTDSHGGTIRTITATVIPTAKPDDVTFYDYDGTIVASYSAASFAQLAEMPQNPAHAGLTAQGWNWTLSAAKAQVAKYGKLNIGQMYITQSGATEIDVTFADSTRLSPILTLSVKGTIVIDWGDNTTPETVTGSSVWTRLEIPHTYLHTGSYTISITAETGNNYAFYCSYQYTLLRRNANAIENSVYANCIKNIRFGNGIDHLDNYSLYYCSGLETITMTNAIIDIGEYAFYHCHSLQFITIPPSNEYIRRYAFAECYSLISVSLPDSITEIATRAFNQDSSLKIITIPDNTETIGTYVFAGCGSLYLVTLPDSITTINEYLFNYCGNLASIIIPDSVTSLSTNAFYQCTTLSSLIIPADVTSISSGAISNLYGIKELHLMPDTPPTLGAAISNLSSDAIIYVPSASLNTYKTETNWSAYASYMQGE